MTARILAGKPVASDILASVKARADALREIGVIPRVAFVAIGDVPDGQMYVGRMEKLAGPVGVAVQREQFAEDVPLPRLQDALQSINADPEVDGIIVQMPLPGHLAVRELAAHVDPRKDVDGITIENSGRLYLGLPAHRPSTAVAMFELLLSAGAEIAGRRAVVLGRSQVVGHPLAELLLRANATVTIAHSKTLDLAACTRAAEILCVAIGRPRFVTADMVAPGAVVVDAGINIISEGLVGDVDFEECLPRVGAITPVPGGVGPVTNAVLLRNVIESAEQRSRM